jgi:hypothetical protein
MLNHHLSQKLKLIGKSKFNHLINILTRKVSGTIGKFTVPIVESDRSPSLVTEGSLEPEVFDDAIDPEGSKLENRVDELDMEIDQGEDFDEDSFAEQGIDQKEDFGDDSFAE